MRRSLLTLAGLLFASALADAQHIYFTTFVPGSCPIVIEGMTHSKDFGFQSVLFWNDSGRLVESVHLKVTLSSPKTQEQIVDSGHTYVAIEPGSSKSQDVFLGRMQSLQQRAKFDHLEIARATISVESVEFADGSHWSADGLAILEPTDSPGRPLPR